MKMVLDDCADLNRIDAYAPGRVRIGGRDLSPPLLVWPRELDADWPVERVERLSPEALARIVERAPEVLVLGTGERQRFPAPEIPVALARARIGCEVMDNAAACRTFNILLAEGRDAALLLLGPDDGA